ncbi:inositol monophosphatase family protein [Candidatus Liberibacter brunswickensis]|uniref:inositol monophosphatase family protein n=1 Tax=Candidatus Liberibacter brunswickensis TaxID=1968796 RepID=UPI002FE38C3A
MSRSALLNVMVSAALKSGKSLSRDFGEVQNLQVSLKGSSDFVMRSHSKCQEIIYQELSSARPKYGFYSKGKTCDGQDSMTRWIVDPLNGYTNFLYAIPHFCISIALERDQEIVASVIFNPITDELYTAERGSGSFLNDRRVRISSRRILSKSIICYGVSHIDYRQNSQFLNKLGHIMNEAVGVRNLGSEALALAYIAAGRFDGFCRQGLSKWCATASGLLLVREAGGFSTNLLGGKLVDENKGILSGNMYIYKQLLSIMNR